MDLQKVVLADPSSELVHSFNKYTRLKISYCSAKLNYTNIWLFVRIVHRYTSNSLYPILHGIREMRHKLHGLSKIVTPSLSLDDVGEYFTGSDVVFSGKGNVEVAFTGTLSIFISDPRIEKPTSSPGQDQPLLHHRARTPPRVFV